MPIISFEGNERTTVIQHKQYVSRETAGYVIYIDIDIDIAVC
jgi:hypothetical protein